MAKRKSKCKRSSLRKRGREFIRAMYDRPIMNPDYCPQLVKSVKKKKKEEKKK